MKNQKNRTIKSAKNVFVSLSMQMGQLIVNFISRTIFIYILGVEYLGINGLFTNILTLLSLTELGFGNAIIYSMYKPLAENDTKKLSALMNFYKKIYRIIACIVFVLGMLLVPLLQYLVSMNDINISLDLLRVYYILFLLNSVSSYLFAYKSTIISADQKMYIVKKCMFVGLFIQSVLQIVILFFTHNYILYLLIQVFSTFLSNLYIAWKANKMYPFINDKNELANEEKSKIYNNVGSIFIYKISGTVLNNTDNILISVLVSTLVVGYYSNYSLLINAILGIISIIFNAVSASVGNLNITANHTQNKKVFEEMSLICYWIMSISSICLFYGLNDFVGIWLGEQYLLSPMVLSIIILNYYIYGSLNPLWTFRDTTGIFKDARNASIFAAILNLVLSIILGRLWGLFGILLATAISRLLTTYWYQPYVLYKKIFKTRAQSYYSTQLKYFFVLIVITLLLSPIMKLFHGITLINLILKMILCFLLSMILVGLFTIRDKNMTDIIGRIKMILGSIIPKGTNK